MPERLDRARELLQLLKYRQCNERLRYFKPNSSQKRWIDEIKRDDAFIAINAAGNGSGKTFGIIAILGALCWPELRPNCFDGLNFKGPKRARIISTPKELEEVGSIQSTIEYLWPRGRYEGKKDHKSYNNHYYTDTGWVIDLMSYEQDVSEFAGPNLGAVVFNEPMPKPIWDESVARTRSGGLILAAMTSLRDNPWVVDGLLSKANGKDIRMVYGDIEDNCKEHGQNGTLDHKQIEKILAMYDPDEREARKTGKPLRFSGRIYKTFSRDIHVAKRDITFPENIDEVKFFMAIDPAIGKPFAAVWAFVDHEQVVHIFDEYPNTDFEGAKDSNLTLRDYATIFKQKERSCKGAEIDRIIDRHFANNRDIRGFTLKEQFADRDNGGLDFIDSYKCQDAKESEVETGIITVKEYLRYNQAKPIDHINKPRLVISPKCTNTILSFERWTRDPDTLKPSEHYKDHADCVRYLLMADPRWERQRQWRPQHQPGYGVGTAA